MTPHCDGSPLPRYTFSWQLGQAATYPTRLSLYPQITLTGGIGAAGAELSQALQDPIATLTAAVTAPFVQFDRAKYTTRLVRTQQDEAIVAFRETLLRALYDVDDALSIRTQLAEEAGQLENSLRAAKEVERLWRSDIEAVPSHFSSGSTHRRRVAKPRLLVIATGFKGCRITSACASLWEAIPGTRGCAGALRPVSKICTNAWG